MALSFLVVTSYCLLVLSNNPWQTNPLAAEEFEQSQVGGSLQVEVRLCAAGVLIVQERRKGTRQQQHTILAHGK